MYDHTKHLHGYKNIALPYDCMNHGKAVYRGNWLEDVSLWIWESRNRWSDTGKSSSVLYTALQLREVQISNLQCTAGQGSVDQLFIVHSITVKFSSALSLGMFCSVLYSASQYRGNNFSIVQSAAAQGSEVQYFTAHCSTRNLFICCIVHCSGKSNQVK